MSLLNIPQLCAFASYYSSTAIYIASNAMRDLHFQAVLALPALSLQPFPFTTFFSTAWGPFVRSTGRRCRVRVGKLVEAWGEIRRFGVLGRGCRAVGEIQEWGCRVFLKGGGAQGELHKGGRLKGTVL